MLLVASALGLLIAFAPMLVPTRWLAGRIAAAVSRQIGEPVHIAAMSLSWSDGVQIERLTVGDLDEPLLEVPRLRCPLQPVQMLVQSRIDRIEVYRPQLWITLSRSGQLDLDACREALAAEPLTDQWLISEAAIHLVNQQRAVTQTVHLAALRLEQDPAAATADWQFSGHVAGFSHAASAPGAARPARLVSEGQLTLPRLRPDRKLDGHGRFEWDRLELSSIPQPLLALAGIERTAGQASGALDVVVAEDLSLEFLLTLQMRNVHLHYAHRAADRILSARLRTDGRWDPTAEVLTFRETTIDIPGLRLAGAGPSGSPAIVLSPGAATPIRMDLAGEADDIQLLRQQFTELDVLLGPATRTEGRCRVRLKWHGGLHADDYAFAAEGEEIRLQRDGLLRASVLPVRAEMHIRRDYAAGTLDIRRLGARLGPLEIAASGQLPIPTDADKTAAAAWLARLWQTGQVDVAVRTERLEALIDLLDLHESIAARVQAAGPAELEMRARPGEGGTRVSLRASLPPPSTVRLGEAFAKPAGEALSAELAASVEHGHATALQRLEIDLRHGPGRLHVSPDDSAARLALRRAVSIAGEYELHTHWRSRVTIANIERLAALLPAWNTWRASGQRALTGDADFMIETNGLYRLARRPDQTIEFTERVLRVVANADLGGLTARLDDIVDKPGGQPARVELRYRHDATNPADPHTGTVEVVAGGAALSGRFRSDASAQQTDAAIRVDDCRQALALVPALRRRLAPHTPTGRFAATVRARSDNGRSADGGAPRRELDVAIDADGLGFVVPGAQPFTKPAAMPCRLAGRLRWRAPAAADETVAVEIDSLTAALASCVARIDTGQVVADAAIDRAFAVDRRADRLRWLRVHPFREVDLHGGATLIADTSVRQVWAPLAAWADRLDLIGRCEMAGRLMADRDHARLAGRLDATRLNVHAAGLFVKPTGVEATLELDLATAEQPRGAVEPALDLIVRHVGLHVAGSTVIGQGNVTLYPESSARRWRWRLGSVNLELAGRSDRLAPLTALTPPARPFEVDGGAEMEATLSAEGTRVLLGASRLRFHDTTARLAGLPIRLDGRVDLSARHLATPGVVLAIGDARMQIAGEVSDLLDRPTGQIIILADSLDLNRLGEWARRLADAEDAAQPLSPATPAVAEAMQRLRRCHLTGRVHVHHAALSLPSSSATTSMPAASQPALRYELHELVSDFSLRNGRIEVPFDVALNGGFVRGLFRTALSEPNPLCEVEYDADRLAPRDNVRPFVEDFFPGMTVTGPISNRDVSRQRLFDQPGKPNFPVGSGVLRIDGGSVAGRAAPLWLTRIFPGLNLAKYEFETVIDRYTRTPDGTQHNDMSFLGRRYHVYMTGTTTHDKRIDYEVGIDLLAKVHSALARAGNGRIPLFTKTGTILPDGTLGDETVRFIGPVRTMESLLKNNLVYTAYLLASGRTRQEAEQQFGALRPTPP